MSDWREIRALKLGDEPAPADPAGLDAAIEASLVAYDHALNDSLRNPSGSVMGPHGRAQLGESVPWRAAITAAVRAAAPHLRAAALNEAADEWRRQHEHLGAMAAYRWLRERAGREATTNE